MIAEQLFLQGTDPTMVLWFLPLIIWEVIWKGIALWKSGRNSQLTWFIFILIINSLGILPIIYLAFFQKKTKPTKANRSRKPSRKRK